MTSVPSVLTGARCVLVPVEAAHVPHLLRALATAEVRARWGDEGARPNWPFDEPDVVRFSVMVDGAVRGMVQYGEEHDPDYRHAYIDIFLDPIVHNRGVGRDAVSTLARYLFSQVGHHRIVIDPAADNVAAVRSYAAVGFRPVGVMRQYEKDSEGEGWHDNVLMDLLAEDLKGASSSAESPLAPVRMATVEDTPEVLRLAALMYESMGMTTSGAQWATAAAEALSTRLGGDVAVFVVGDPATPGRLVATGAGSVAKRLPAPLNPDAFVGYVQWMSTEPGWRRRGLATAIAKALLAWFSERGVATVELHAVPGAQNLYRSLGFSDGPNAALRLRVPAGRG